LPKDNRIEVNAPSLGLARIGASKIMGTTARSWNTRMPIVARPWSESLSPLAVKLFSTIAVLLSDSRKPQKIACGHGNPTSVPPNHTIATTPPT
jgi:hypothetical protein